ncbi:bestrophin-like domain [Embleya hyalina]|uniref:DUF4239 domain-containing protein n=1 Tax=Embleya hyalina TaxID=516124 RepID=A0A401YME7_9ACTN|nr:DUF4239 domain-containing protein [Embleya hyalina]GCD95790.1 hypothetical protein EHYA_03473 [Embleya hyalina]
MILWILAALLGAGVAAGALVLLSRADKTRSSGTDGQLLSFCGGAVLSSFVLLTSFQIVGAWELQATVRQHASDEARVLTKTYAAAGALPAPDREAVRAGLRDYTHTVIDKEWPALADGHDTPGAWRQLDLIASRVAALAATAHDRTADTEAAVADLYVKRHARLADPSSITPIVLPVAMIVTGVFAIVFPALVGPTADRRHATALAFVGAIIAFAVLFVLQLRNPYTDPLAVHPTSFRTALTRYTQLG